MPSIHFNCEAHPRPTLSSYLLLSASIVHAYLYTNKRDLRAARYTSLRRVSCSRRRANQCYYCINKDIQFMYIYVCTYFEFVYCM
jgi:hypothetical protein